MIYARTLWLCYFECDLAVSFMTQEDDEKPPAWTLKQQKYEFCLIFWITESEAIEQWFSTKAVLCFHNMSGQLQFLLHSIKYMTDY